MKIIENKYGKIELLEETKLSENTKFKCHCGEIGIAKKEKLLSKHTKSCGCVRKIKIDIIGKKFGLLKVIEYYKKGLWKCKCNCGKYVYINKASLKRRKSCGNCPSFRLKNIEGQTINGRKILSRIEISPKFGSIWKVICSCGKELNLPIGIINKSKCTCNHPLNINNGSHHWQNNKDIYKIWFKAKQYNLLCDSFKNPDNFINYIKENLGEKPEKCRFLLRKDLSKIYEPGNLKWKTSKHKTEINGKPFIWCTSCEQYLPESDKLWSNRKNDSCKKCAINKKNKKNYNLSPEDYENLLNKNDGKCHICNISPLKSLCVDHCHKTNIVRGVLCSECNLGVGLFKDNIDYMKNAIKYLKRGDTKYKYKKIKNEPIEDICPITGSKDGLCCDHNHKSGFIRGNIDKFINSGIGKFKDSIEILESAIKYLEKYNDQN